MFKLNDFLFYQEQSYDTITYCVGIKCTNYTHTVDTKPGFWDLWRTFLIINDCNLLGIGEV